MLAQLLLDTYFPGRTSYAIARNGNGTISYYPVEGTPTLEDVERHLRGEIVLGGYTLMSDSRVNYITLDVDSSDLQKARNIAAALSEQLGDIPHGIEFSGNKGYHITLYLTEPVPAAKAKAYGISLREAVGAPSSGDPHVEVFPKQDALTPSSPLGNLIKLPLGEHPKTHNRSVFVDRINGWEAGPEVEPLGILRARIDFKDLEEQLAGSTPVQKMALLLGGYWIQGERHNLCLALSGFLASLGWSRDNVLELVEALIANSGGDEDNLIECVNTTFRRLADNKTVQGFSALNERLPVSVMRSLSDLAGQNIADPGIQLIDRIRMDKGTAAHLKVRSAASTIFANLSDSGKFAKTENALYWLDLGSHKLINMEQVGWLSTIHGKFGINTKESFGTQVVEAIRLASYDRAAEVKIHKRFHWDGRTLHINFGGAEVYQLNGNKRERKLSYNGADEFLFMSNMNGLTEEMAGLDILQTDPLNPWDYLTNDLSFDPSEENAANNEQQRQLLQAWILQMFFGTIMNTRPIALLMGPRGSGKTTTARRILRFFEGFQEDVLGIAEDKPDSLRASLEDHLVLALDNMEKTKVRWLDNFLNRLATGTQIELRKLHHTNETYTIRPDCFVLATGIELPTDQESLFSRILPLALSPLRFPKSEFLIQSRLKDNMAGVWSGMFDHLDDVIRQLNMVRSVATPNGSRLADFVLFCNRVKGSSALKEEALVGGLESLMVRQNAAMSASSPAITVLDMWLGECAKSRIVTEGSEMDSGSWRNSGELWKVLNETAKKANFKEFRWTTPASFARHWILLAQGGLGDRVFETRKFWNPNNKREEEQFRFPLVTV